MTEAFCNWVFDKIVAYNKIKGVGGDYVVPSGGGGGGNESDLRWDGRRPDEPDFAFQRRCFSHAVKYIMAKYSVKQNKGRAR